MPHVSMPDAIRRALLNDIPAIRALEQRSPSAAHWTSVQYEKLVCEGVILVAEEAGAICGFICAKTVAGEWEIENVAVAAEIRRRGIAGALLRTLIQQAKDESTQTLLLEVRESNTPARRLYEKHAFREVGHRRAYYTNPAEDAILYALQLNT
jgi:ribosomal-protein-alanine acetyltransferase